VPKAASAKQPDLKHSRKHSIPSNLLPNSLSPHFSRSSKKQNKLYNKSMLSLSRALTYIRFSLGVTFLWFGVLKLFNASPVLDIIRKAMPTPLAESQIFMFALALLEILIGLAFLTHKFVKLASIIMIGHLLVATASVLITQGFSPRFPILSLAGEFVVKNLVLIAAGLALFTQKSDEPSHKTKETQNNQKDN
jgi:uncharacterized membrane protein YphA (DoxX/SURF4 family)